VRNGLGFLVRYRDLLQAAGVSADQHLLLTWAAFGRSLLTRNEFLFVE